MSGVKSDINFILYQNDWIKLWDFYFSIWFLDILADIHLKYKKNLGFENKNTLHVFDEGTETAFFLQQEIDQLRNYRRKKLMSPAYMKRHYLEAKGAILNLKKFLIEIKQKNRKQNDLLLFLKYGEALKKMLSYYRSSRPEIFEIVEGELKNNKVTSKKKKYLKNLIKIYGHLRWELKNVWFSAEKEIIWLKKRIAKYICVNIKDFEYLTNSEIIYFYNKKHARNYLSNFVNKRRLCVCGIIKSKKIFLTGRAARKVSEHLNKKVEKTDTISGKCAYPGNVRGFIRLIPQTTRSEMIKGAKNFKKGEILVTGMTQPDIIAACRNAKAIITDEGGLTSHAAIVARELKIPCIIGTKIATRVLKDGDLVEVGATKGVVKKI